MNMAWTRGLTRFLKRILGAASLDTQTYEEVESDRTATGQAVLVIALSSIAGGVGPITVNPPGLQGLLIGTLAALVGWTAWAIVTYYVGTRIFPEPQTQADPGQLVRTIGFATAPGLLRLFGAIPGLAPVVFVVTSIWMLAAMVVAVRQALDYTTTVRAIGVCVAGWVLSIVVALVIGLFFAPPVY
jgi:hypothetical protein